VKILGQHNNAATFCVLIAILENDELFLFQRYTVSAIYVYFPTDADRAKEVQPVICTNIDLLPISAGILEQSMGARNRVRIGLSYRPVRLHKLAELIPCNRFRLWIPSL
jgi:hypothetical protein